MLDETALLACAAYVDLNPIRAAMAETLESSDYTSVQRRIEAVQQVASAKAGKTKLGNKAKPKMPSNAKRLDDHLAPLEINERSDATGPRCNSRGYRASDKGFLPIPTAAYLELLDWTARQIKNGKRGSTPKSAKPIFERLGISGEVW